MYEWLIAPFVEFSFMQRAMIGCITIAVSATPVGVFLMLRRMSLTGDAMAHAILPGAAVGFMLAGFSIGAMTIGGIVAGCAVALLSGLVSRFTEVGEDSSMASFYLISLALGVLIISVNGSQIDLLHVLFGSALALNNEALLLLGSIASVTLIALAVMFRPLVMECMDSSFLRSVSQLSIYAHMSFLVLVVLNLVGGFNALGTLMSVGMMILPPAIARYWSSRLDTMILLSIVMAVLACYIGLLASYHAAWPTGSAIILTLGAVYIVSFVVGPKGSLMRRMATQKHKHLSA
ncbi:MAG: zinc ABC transporter permease [Oleiphilus sp.]|nr:MAG: zinc ABC transporter permease [Oleiphilus sp.]